MRQAPLFQHSLPTTCVAMQSQILTWFSYKMKFIWWCSLPVSSWKILCLFICFFSHLFDFSFINGGKDKPNIIAFYKSLESCWLVETRGLVTTPLRRQLLMKSRVEDNQLNAPELRKPSVRLFWISKSLLTGQGSWRKSDVIHIAVSLFLTRRR